MTTTIATMSVSADGYCAGPNQRLDSPFGDGPGEELHRWMTETPQESEAEIAAILGADAYIMGRNMFSPHRGAHDPQWRGWWGEDPPYHAPVFVLTHHERDDLPMDGGTTFHFVTGGLHEAWKRAGQVAGPDGRIHIAGGAETTNQFLTAGLVDELAIQISPVVLGAGTRLFDGVGPLRLEQLSSRGVSLTTHVRYRVVKL